LGFKFKKVNFKKVIVFSNLYTFETPNRRRYKKWLYSVLKLPSKS